MIDIDGASLTSRARNNLTELFFARQIQGFD